MAKIFLNQSKLRLIANCNVDITGASSTLIKYKKPDDSTGSFTATVSDAENGLMFYDVSSTSDIDQIGTWIMWSYIVFSDSGIAEGLPIKVVVYTSGEII